jgi:autotransporter translocation and assembly factor TamB
MRATGAVDLSGRSDLQYELTANLAAYDRSWTRHALMVACVCGDRRPASGLTHRTWHLDVRDVQYQEYILDALRLTYEASDLGAQPNATTQLRLQRAHLGALALAQIELQGTYDGAARQVRFEVSMDQSPGNGMSTQGRLTLQETGQRVDIDVLRLQLAERVWEAATPVQVTHEADRLQFTPLRLVHAEESLEISGGIAGEQLQDIRVHASQIDLSIVQRLMAIPDPMHGRATLQVLLSGTLPAPLLHVDLNLQPEGRQNLPSKVCRPLAYAEQLLQGQVRSNRQTGKSLPLTCTSRSIWR